MMLPKFEDVHPAYHGPNSYRQTNEEAELHNMLMKGYRIRKAASIASGGEIPISVLLPRCREVVCIDHAYGSLMWSFLKAALLAQNGPRRMKALLLEESVVSFQHAIGEAFKLVPTDLILNAKRLGGTVTVSGSDQSAWRKEWFHASEMSLERAYAKLDKLTFVHGDIADLKERGPFDCFYVSNAHEHANRYGHRPKSETFMPLLKDSGLLLVADASNSGADNSAFPSHDWQRVRMFRGLRTTWCHQLMKKMPTPVLPKPIVAAPLIGPAIATSYIAV